MDRNFRRRPRKGRGRGNAPMSEEEVLIADIHSIQAEERRLQTELLDVFSDVTTPEGTDEEEEEEIKVPPKPTPTAGAGAQRSPTSESTSGNTPGPSSAESPAPSASKAQPETAQPSEPEATSSTEPELSSSPTSRAARDLLDQMLSAHWEPSDSAVYAELYSYAEYTSNVSKKMKKMKKIARSVDIRAVHRDERFWQELDRIRHLYPDDGGRGNLYRLIALYCYLDTINRPDSSSDWLYSDDEDSDFGGDRDEDDDDRGVGGKKMKLGGDSFQGAEIKA